MLIRLRIQGFKNFLDTEIHFGPFTCVAGPNGIGKSNLFDAIRFISMLADRPLIEAAMSVRDEKERTNTVDSLFYRAGAYQSDRMSFEADIIVPKEGVDDLGQPAKATSNLLKYSLTIARCPESSTRGGSTLKILSEGLTYIPRSRPSEKIPFPHRKSWRDSVMTGERRSPYISTRDGIVKVHQDGKGGRPWRYSANSLPRTVLSSVNALEAPTVLMARQELQSWKLLQLEPSCMRAPDTFTAPPHLGSDGSHLPATLHRLAMDSEAPQGSAPRIYAEITNRLANLVDDIHDIQIDIDERRELLTLEAAGRDMDFHAARSLSDGTLRFLALAVMERDPESVGLICMEEPENGIHPERIEHMVDLLLDLAMDTDEPMDRDNPFRQIIINTHSPIMVRQVPQDSLLFMTPTEVLQDSKRLKSVSMKCFSKTWRADKTDADTILPGIAATFLNPPPPTPLYDTANPTSKTGPMRVAERPDVQGQLWLDFPREESEQR